MCLKPSSHLFGFRNIVFAQDARLSFLQIIEQDLFKRLFLFGQMAKPPFLLIVVQDYCVVLPDGRTIPLSPRSRSILCIWDKKLFLPEKVQMDNFYVVIPGGRTIPLARIIQYDNLQRGQFGNLAT